MGTTTYICLPLRPYDTFIFATTDQLTEWKLTWKYMIDGISSSQGFISRVKHKTRQVTELFAFYVPTRSDGLHARKHQVALLISQHLHFGYQPTMYPPYGKPSELVLYLENRPYTTYARVVLSTRITMTLDETKVVCYPVKDVGVPEELTYDFLTEDRKTTTTKHFKLKIYAYPLHLWTIREVEHAVQPHCIVEHVSPATLNFRKLRSINCTTWTIRNHVLFPWYMLIHVSSKYDRTGNQNDMHRKTKTFCVGIDIINIKDNRHRCVHRSHRRTPSFLEALK